MLMPAQMYREKLNNEATRQWYDIRNMYYHSGPIMSEYNIDDNTGCGHYFVSVDKDDNVLGYIGYAIDWSSKRVYNFGFLSFQKGNMTFVRDSYQAFKNLFEVYHFHSVEFLCYVDNPAVRGYRNLMRKFGGRECAYMRDEALLLDGKLHDAVKFEILDSDYFNERRPNRLGCKIVEHKSLVFIKNTIEEIKGHIADERYADRCSDLLDEVSIELSEMMR